MNPILEGLNEDQTRAVTHEGGPLLILAGAGSGKTRAITRRIAYLVRERSVYPGRILAVTFTNKAAQEMKERVRVLLDDQDAPRWMGTFHSICLRFLRRHADLLGYPKDFVVYDDDDQDALLRRILKGLGIKKPGTGYFRAYIDSRKNDGETEPEESPAPIDQQRAEVHGYYQTELRKAGAMDFGDLLCHALALLRDNPEVREGYQFDFEHILVDEFQDTNLAQYDLVKHMVGDHGNICVVGDDDQAIYSWRGARVENILEFQKDFPDASVVTLRNNYRSKTPILGAASRVINFNHRRHEKELDAVRGEGRPVILHTSFSERDEAIFVVKQVRSRAAEGVPFERMAVFYRTHAQSRVFEDALRVVRIPYRVIGGMKFYQRREVKDVIAYLRLLVNPSDSVSLERIVNIPPRGIGAVTLQKVRDRSTATGDDLLSSLAGIGDEAKPVLKARIRDFIELVTDLAARARERDAEEVVRATLQQTGYLDYLGREGTQESQNRLENVEELLASVREIGETSGRRDIMTYLDRVSLLQPLDQVEGTDIPDALNLMTIHAAKGLEFEHVFLCGLEEGLFPHQNSIGSAMALEEERRLMYVAMTRARDGLCLSHATTRVRFGGIHAMPPSRFLSELPHGELQVV